MIIAEPGALLKPAAPVQAAGGSLQSARAPA